MNAANRKLEIPRSKIANRKSKIEHQRRRAGFVQVATATDRRLAARQGVPLLPLLQHVSDLADQAAVLGGEAHAQDTVGAKAGLPPAPKPEIPTGD